MLRLATLIVAALALVTTHATATDAPTLSPSTAPSQGPSLRGTTTPTRSPSHSPVWSTPSSPPSHSPVSSTPSSRPSHSPVSSTPSSRPSSRPSSHPTHSPSRTPTTSKPSSRPSKSPSRSPTRRPTTPAPTPPPSNSPTLGLKQYNVLLLIVDDLKPNLGSYGPSSVPRLTPNMDKLAAKGVRFMNAFAQFAECGPSRASFLTGTRPDTTGVYGLNPNILHNAIVNTKRQTGNILGTLPQLFKQNGYTTIGAGKVFHESEPILMRDPDMWTVPVYTWKTP